MRATTEPPNAIARLMSKRAAADVQGREQVEKNGDEHARRSNTLAATRAISPARRERWRELYRPIAAMLMNSTPAKTRPRGSMGPRASSTHGALLNRRMAAAYGAKKKITPSMTASRARCRCQ